MIQAVLVFLLVMVLIGALGKLRGLMRPPPPRRDPRLKEARRCPDCGTFVVGGGPCPCRDPNRDT